VQKKHNPTVSDKEASSSSSDKEAESTHNSTMLHIKA
jgi:hypothetical protein